MTRIALLCIAAFALAGCAGPSCLQDKPYRSAGQFPILEAPAGLTVPEPNPNMQIPQVESGPVGFYPDSKDFKPERMRCLAMPRRFEPSADSSSR